MRCPLCDDARPARHVLRAHGSDLVRCLGCGLVRVDPWPTAAAALAQYDAAYFEDADRGYRDYEGDEALFRAEFRRRLRTLRSAGAGGALLDVGCAAGGLLAEAQAAGFAPSGIEPAVEVARRAAERTGAPVRATSLDAALIAPSSYDVVTLFDVLEHVVDPRAALRKLRIALRPGGLIGVTVPDFGGAWARASGRHWPFVTPWEHLLYFTRRTLYRALLAAGFEAVRFHAARTPVAFGTIAAKGPWPGRGLPRALLNRGVLLPFGTTFAVAAAPGPEVEPDVTRARSPGCAARATRPGG